MKRNNLGQWIVTIVSIPHIRFLFSMYLNVALTTYHICKIWTYSKQSIMPKRVTKKNPKHVLTVALLFPNVFSLFIYCRLISLEIRVVFFFSLTFLARYRPSAEHCLRLQKCFFLSHPFIVEAMLLLWERGLLSVRGFVVVCMVMPYKESTCRLKTCLQAATGGPLMQRRRETKQNRTIGYEIHSF